MNYKLFLSCNIWQKNIFLCGIVDILFGKLTESWWYFFVVLFIWRYEIYSV